MKYRIMYSCVSHVGRIRNNNQDNFICNRCYREIDDEDIAIPLCGEVFSEEFSVFGVFDGMGGEECGEVASYVAAKDAKDIEYNKNTATSLLAYCNKANSDICEFAKENGISAMGTTAALLAFTRKGVTLCNIGDSRIFRFSRKVLEQISVDHVTAAPFGAKPPLLQNLGIPPNEMVIEPYLAHGEYCAGDIYLICSDGLTDMVTTDEIAKVLAEESVDSASMSLLDKALANGGKDNITIILCKIERRLGGSFGPRRHKKTGR